jgi:hypothetical protein
LHDISNDVSAFRKELERLNPGLNTTNRCWLISKHLQQFLFNLGYENVQLIIGTYKNKHHLYPHTFLLWNNLIIDITADQFYTDDSHKIIIIRNTSQKYIKRDLVKHNKPIKCKLIFPLIATKEWRRK